MAKAKKAKKKPQKFIRLSLDAAEEISECVSAYLGDWETGLVDGTYDQDTQENYNKAEKAQTALTQAIERAAARR